MFLDLFGKHNIPSKVFYMYDTLHNEMWTQLKLVHPLYIGAKINTIYIIKSFQWYNTLIN